LRELHELDEFHAYLDEFKTLSHTILQHIDLRQVAPLLKEIPVDGAVFLGCALPAEVSAQLLHKGAWVFPDIPELPFQPYRAFLYSPEALFAGFDPADPLSYCQTPDNLIYQHWRNNGQASPTNILEGILRRIHDQSITDALLEFLEAHPRPTVAIMGGHAMLRNASAYQDIAVISRTLTRKGFLMVSGGGPGAMEATHLGSWLSEYSDDALLPALNLLATAPHYRDKHWLSAAYQVRQTWPRTQATQGISLGIPTWLYGHEPPNPFATHVAKYFNNSLREDGLVTVAHNGIVFTPGSAGTIQEIFQDACQNHYATTGYRSPMVFLGKSYWTETMPVIPLLKTLAAGKPYERMIYLCDSVAEVLDILQSTQPVKDEKADWSFCKAFGGKEN